MQWSSYCISWNLTKCQPHTAGLEGGRWASPHVNAPVAYSCTTPQATMSPRYLRCRHRFPFFLLFPPQGFLLCTQTWNTPLKFSPDILYSLCFHSTDIRISTMCQTWLRCVSYDNQLMLFKKKSLNKINQAIQKQDVDISVLPWNFAGPWWVWNGQKGKGKCCDIVWGWCNTTGRSEAFVSVAECLLTSPSDKDGNGSNITQLLWVNESMYLIVLCKQKCTVFYSQQLALDMEILRKFSKRLTSHLCVIPYK